MKNFWTAIEQWLMQYSPRALASLRPAADTAVIDLLETSVGIPLPGELREWLAIHDGQQLQARCGLLDGWIFLPAQEIAKVHRTFGDLLRRGDFSGNIATNKDGSVKPVWWNSSWIPFIEGPGGDLLCFDMDPAEEGRPGQIITFWKADGRRRARSNRLAELLQDFADDLDSGAYDVQENGGLVLA